METPGARHVAEIIHVGRLLYEHRYVVAGEGNRSVRLDDRQALVTASGVCKGRLVPADIVTVPLAETAGDGTASPRPSSEWPLHRMIYSLVPGARAVCHAHPPRATAFAVARRPLPVDLLPEARAFLGDVPLVPYARPGSEELAREVARRLGGTARALLLANHGVVAWGGTLEEAFMRLELTERLAEVAWLALPLGGGIRLTRQQAQELMEEEPEA